ncbi:LysR family transcriptional regulator [Rhizocola hellebori]|uniref:LysR family transcriptional regulator n=1 Tax=Rhizocola hellebori TaxID=1392758 RepID=A0A8J3VDA1_9ACTN|nr:LysR family transcriptional regulator [Rhizocola hellebori]GIH02098.1 LysR family transcriptional regulator [Rhizocola hellebori]
MDLEIRHMRAVCAIADTGSLTKAAAALGLSQPALTAQLQRVERELGGPLFTRSRQGAALTRLGEFVLSRARATLLNMDELRRGAARHHDGGRIIRLGGAMGSVAVGQAHRLGAYLHDIDLRLQMEYSPRLLWELLMAGRLDALTTVDYPGFEVRPPPGIACEVIEFEPVFVALSAQHQFAGRQEIELADLADETWALTPSDGAGWPDCFHAACQQAGFIARVPYTIASRAPICDLVAARQAISACQAVFEVSEGIVVRPLAGSPIVMRHLLACRRDGPLAPHLAMLLRFGQEAHHDYAQRAPSYLAWRAARRGEFD